MEYDAILTNWEEIPYGRVSLIVGTITEDKKGRFRDGDYVRTSIVKELNREEGYAQTLNTKYKLVNEVNELKESVESLKAAGFTVGDLFF